MSLSERGKTGGDRPRCSAAAMPARRSGGRARRRRRSRLARPANRRGSRFGSAPSTSSRASIRIATSAGDFGLEYHFGDLLYAFSPFVGALGDERRRRATGYFGFGFDINFGPDWVLTPNGAAGCSSAASGTKLGSWWEFRTGAELDYKLADQSRIGLAVHHMSNAGLGKSNPGEEQAVVVYRSRSTDLDLMGVRWLSAIGSTDPSSRVLGRNPVDRVRRGGCRAR